MYTLYDDCIVGSTWRIKLEPSFDMKVHFQPCDSLS